MKKIIVLGMCVVFCWSCNNSGKTASSEESEIHIEGHEEHHYNESSDAIELNNGEKWIVNEEMKPFVLKGSELVDTYIEDGQSDYKELAEQLKDQNDQLIINCTMTGKSHDELHKWLHPKLALVNDLENETDPVKADEIVIQIQNSYLQYHEYFH